MKMQNPISTHCQSAQTRVLSIPELLLTIFEFTTSQSTPLSFSPLSGIPRFALVCRAWTVPAVRLIWRSPPLKAIVELIPTWKTFICETEFPSRGGFVWTAEEVDGFILHCNWRKKPERFDWKAWARSLLPSHYERFMVYQQYILRLSRFEDPEYQMILDAFIRTPNSPFQPDISQPFPNLSVAVWHGDRMSVALRKPHSLLTLSLLSIHAHQIRSLTFYDYKVLTYVFDRLPLFLSTLTVLEDISLPFSISSSLAVCLEALSKCKYLSKLTSTPPDGEPEAEASDFRPLLYKGSFPALKTLDIWGSLENIACFFNIDHGPSKLHTLTIHYWLPFVPQVMTEAFHAIAERCEDIKDFSCESAELHESSLEENSVITYKTLESFKRFRQLEVFNFSSESVLGLSDLDIVNLVDGWKSLRRLTLIGDKSPDHKDNPTPTLNVLIPLAQRCSMLQKLELSVAPRISTESDDQLISQAPSFVSLKVLAIHPLLPDTYPGYVPSGRNPSPGSFLANICPVTCDIANCIPSWAYGNGHVDRLQGWWESAQACFLRVQRKRLIARNRELEARTIPDT
ncbi:hypothetical protein QCA50_017916 [Cerrena zonata]|uniref:F-box domain-containing protein n=1 Tax=Cerrena zonata TaxID=2478898 RepID=A0AAW0FDW6_9APHY